eukprot:PhF_6_TR18160/c0_g1_i1/m.26955/K03872/TCEB1; transcription elongation factor B, polypeptide 1
MSKPKGKHSTADDPQAAPFDPKTLVRLISKEGHEFFVDKTSMKHSRILKLVLEGGPGASNEVARYDGEKIFLDDLPASVLEKFIQYLYYKSKYDIDPDHRPQFSAGSISQVELLLAATVLQA